MLISWRTGNWHERRQPSRSCRRVKCPRSVDFAEELPRHPTGKLYKRLLRDKYWAGRQSKLV